MSSRDRFARRYVYNPPEESSSSHLEDTPSETDEYLHQSQRLWYMSEQSEEPFPRYEAPASTPGQANNWGRRDGPEASFAEQVARRFHQLLERGILKLDADAIVWMDVNGLPTTERLPPLRSEELERPVPIYFVGTDAAVDFGDDAGAGPTVWRQPASEEENSSKRPGPQASLFDLVLEDLRSMPLITHFKWKALLSQFETMSASSMSYSNNDTRALVLQAIMVECRDFLVLENLGKTFWNMEFMRGTDLVDTRHSIYSLAGIDYESSTREADLEMLHDELGSNVSEIMRLAKMVQSKKIPSDRLEKVLHMLNRVKSVLQDGKMESLMKSVLREVR